MLRHLDLFSGIGGFALAAQMVGGIETRQFVEIDSFCQKVLNKNFPRIPIYDDVTTFISEPRRFDLITAGFPCQDISAANPTGRGLEGERSGLFFEIIRILCQCRPSYLVLENSPALLTSRNGRDMGTILWELSQCGYNAEWQIVSAASVGAQHLRKRLFVVANTHPSGSGWEKLQNCPVATRPRLNPWNVPSCRHREATKPKLLRATARIPHRVDRIKSLGNAVVPAVAAVPLRRVLELASI